MTGEIGVRVWNAEPWSWGGTEDGTQEWNLLRKPKIEWEKKHRIQKSGAKSLRSQVPDYAEDVQSEAAQHSMAEVWQGTGEALENTVGPNPENQSQG